MSVYTDRIQQMLSAHSPTCGNSSLTSMPHWPYFLKVNGERSKRAGLPLGLNGPARQRLAVILVKHRLGIEAVHLRKSTVHEKEDDMLRARGVVNTALGPLGETRRKIRLARAPAILPPMPANAIIPNPLPIRQSASRRVIGLGVLCVIVFPSNWLEDQYRER